MTSTVFKMHHKIDPKRLAEGITELDDIVIMHNEVLVGVYIRPGSYETAGGQEIHLPDNFREEDRFQGKVGLVLKKGPQAFVSDENHDFAGQNVEPGDWVVFHSADGWSVTISGVLCRMVEDSRIRMKIPSPDVVY